MTDNSYAAIVALPGEPQAACTSCHTDYPTWALIRGYCPCCPTPPAITQEPFKRATGPLRPVGDDEIWA